MQSQIPHSQFKTLYFQYAQPLSGWTEEYWYRFFETKKEDVYYFEAPESLLASRMMISSGQNTHRMFFLTEEAEESFCQFPNDDDQ
ncbi:MAG: hypothetical protein ACK5RG_08060 [Cyclobacteriaceae bacterium]|jgi:hypothetical protein|nr:hypothetical protein [Flammeovirgaceae bacterium]